MGIGRGSYTRAASGETVGKRRYSKGEMTAIRYCTAPAERVARFTQDP